MRCMSGVLMDKRLLFLCLIICASILVSCDHIHVEHSSPSSPAPCTVAQDYSSTETSLRTAIFDGDITAAAKILCSNEMFRQGWGLRYLPEQTCAIVQTANRRNDPDIVAYQALALSAKHCGGAERLANAIVVSYEKACECSLFDSNERDRMAGAFKDILEDPIAIDKILSFGGPAEDSRMPDHSPSKSHSHHASVSHGHGRRLQQPSDSPTNSFVCSYCDPPEQCSVVQWCP